MGAARGNLFALLLTHNDNMEYAFFVLGFSGYTFQP